MSLARDSQKVAIGSHDLLRRTLLRLSSGEAFEFRGLGRSLWPIVTSGDRLTVRRTTDEAVRQGDIVVAWLPERAVLVCHVVVSKVPVQTAPLFGEPDGRAEVLAKVVGIEGAGRWRFRLGGAPQMVLGVREAGRLVKEHGWSARARSGVEALIGLPGAISLREAALGPLTTRRLTADDLEAAALFAGDHLPAVSVAWFETQLAGAWTDGRGGAVGAFDRHGMLRAFGILGSFRDEGVNVPGMWLRFLYTAPLGRQLGAMRGVVAALLQLAEEQGGQDVFSDTYRDNTPSLNLHHRLGFVEVPGEELAPFEPLLERAKRRGRELVILRWRST